MNNTLVPCTPAKNTISITQEKLHHKFKYFGAKHLEFRQKCIGLLPQILKERIYQKKGFCSIFEYAAKLAGLSREQVSRALNIHDRFHDKPTLKNLFETGEVSVNKLARIASIATVGNEKNLADHVRIMSQKAIEILVKDFRRADTVNHAETENAHGNIAGSPEENEIRNGLQKPLFDDKSVRAHNMCEQSEQALARPAKLIELKLTAENLEKLLELQNKNININEIIETALAKRKTEIAQSKAEAAKEYGHTETKPPFINIKPADERAKTPPSRHIPAKIRKIIDAEQGDKCSAPGCNKPAQIIHHELPFAMTKTHDPNYLKKLCREHHEIRHTININFVRIKNAAINTG